MDNSPKGSTFKLTSYTPWRIIHRRLECMAPRIRIQLKLYVPYFHIMQFIQNSFSTVQGELEHRTSKGRFIRTSRKAYVPQLASIERRQARIRRIRMRHDALNLADPVPNEAEEHHVIGQSQNFPEDLTRFMRTNMGDPAVEVSLYSRVMVIKHVTMKPVTSISF
jgi:hypothetical protein